MGKPVPLTVLVDPEQLRRLLEQEGLGGPVPSSGCLVDTSVIIDGRIEGIVKTGFLRDPLVVPRFVLRELQGMADSKDDRQRMKGRKGLALLEELSRSTMCSIVIHEADTSPGQRTDQELALLARTLRIPLLTTDTGLQLVASIEGVTVLNINELASALKPVFSSGDPLEIQITGPGKEQGQGIGFLEDGTMVIVENGKGLVGRKMRVTIRRVLQTPTGQLVFAALQQT